MKQKTPIVIQMYAELLRQLASWQIDINAKPADWHASLQRAVADGAFIRLHVGYGAGGVIDASLVLVSPNGAESTPLSIVEAHHV